jgi:hypothetical protein
MSASASARRRSDWYPVRAHPEHDHTGRCRVAAGGDGEHHGCIGWCATCGHAGEHVLVAAAQPGDQPTAVRHDRFHDVAPGGSAEPHAAEGDRLFEAVERVGEREQHVGGVPGEHP